jgi:hypothetical protein
MLYHLLARQMPYVPLGAHVSNRTVLELLIQGPPLALNTLRTDVPAELLAITEKAMARDASQRYPSTRALAEDLRAYLERRVVGAYEVGSWAETKKWVQRNRGLATAVVGIAVLLASALWVSLTLLGRAREAEAAAKERALEAGESSRAAQDATQRKELALSEARGALRRSEGLRLLVNSSLVLKADPTLALLLAIEGAHRAPGIESNNALLSALRTRRERWVLRTGVGWIGAHGNQDNETAATYSPDGSRVATVAVYDDAMRIWDASTGREIQSVSRIGFTSGPLSIRYSPDGSLIAIASPVYALIYDARTLRRVSVIRASHETTPPSQATLSTARAEFDATGTLLVVWFGDYVVHIWNISCGEDQATLTGHTGYVGAIDVSASCGRVATGSQDGSARVWDLVTGCELVRLEGHGLGVGNVALSADGSRLLTAAGDGTDRLWDLRTGHTIAVLGVDLDDVVHLRVH